MLEAATALFLEKGYEGVSLSDIVERSGGSRTMLYEQFGNKEGLLKAMVERATTRTWQAVDWDPVSSVNAEAALRDLGRRFLQAVLADDAVATFRIIVTEARRMPGLAAFFFEHGPKRVQARLTAWFVAAAAAGLVRAEQPEALARVFVGGVFADLHLRRVLGLAAGYSEAEIEAHLTIAVSAFVDGVLSRPANTAA